jgi:HpcH/HpaI aldolase/citrate lyase family
MIDFVLFECRQEASRAAVAAGIDSLIVDLEWRDKERRQQGADTEINCDRVESLADLVAAGARQRFCRVNAWGEWTAAEVERALEQGATHLFLPMAREASVVERFVRQLDGRAAAGALIETADAVERAAEFAATGLSYVYVGLNDLSIDRGRRPLFEPVADGTVEGVRAALPGVAFGFAGATVVDGGDPVPCRLLLGEMARLDCAFTFLRRSWRREVADRDAATEIARLRATWRKLGARDSAAVARDREALLAAIAAAERPPR